MPERKLIEFNQLIAGVCGGVTSTFVVHPLDLIKIRFQVFEGTRVVNRPEYKGIGNAFMKIFRDEGGFRALYRGAVPNLTGSGASWGLYFLFYEAIKTQMLRAGWGDREKHMLSTPHHLLAGASAGATTLCFTNPIWVTKTRLCLQYSSNTVGTLAVGGGSGQPVQMVRYTGMFNALYQIARTEGIRGLYRGFAPGLFGVSHGAFQFAAYEKLKNFFHQRHDNPAGTTNKLSTSEYLICAAVSKTFAVVITYPYQVIRSRLQDQHRNYSGAMDVIRQTSREGVRGFYKGLLPNVLRVTPACCITFLVYENTISFLRTHPIR